MAESAAEDSHLAAAGAHKPGSIQKILLKNFLTYKDAVIRPGARLNIVCGANGTGKSSILNAICLGLGGEPKLLGRADDARDYVMHGEQKASIEITLASEFEDTAHVIERVIDRNRGKEKGNGRGASTFFINGEKVNVKDVRELVLNEYKITIDNLCTFLPQDKVSSFSSMSEQDRLVETERTLDGDLYDMHQQLIQSVDEFNNQAGDVESLKQKLKKYQHENEQLERAALLVAERQKALEEAEMIGKKKLWVEFEQLRTKAIKLKEAKTEVKKKIAAITTELQPLQEKEDKLQALRQKAEADYKAHNDETSRCKKELEKQSSKYDSHDDKIEDILSQLNELDSKRSKLEADAKTKQARLDEVESSMANFPSLDKIEADFKVAQGKRREATKKHEHAKRQEHDIDSQIKELEEQGHRHQQRVAKLNNVAENRKKVVYKVFPALLNVTTLVNSERGSFRRQVWGPVACEIAAKSKQVAAMLEQHVPNPCLKSYVVEEKRDYDRLYNWIRGEKNLPINVNLIPNGELKPFERWYSEKKMATLKQQHGILGYLDELFTAPDAIMQNLRNAGQVHKVLVGNDATMDSIDSKGLLDFLAKPEAGQDSNKAVAFCVFATRGQAIIKFTGKASRYTGKITISQEQVRDASFLTLGVNEQEKQIAEGKLADVHKQADDLRPKVQEAQHIRRQLETEAQEAAGEAEAASKMKSHVVKFQNKHEQAKRNLQEALDALNCNDAEEKEHLATNLMHLVSNSLVALCAHSDQHEKLLKSTIASAGAAANKSSVTAAVSEARLALQDKKAAYAEIEQEARRIQADFVKTKKDAGAKKAVAEEKAPLMDEDGNDTELKHRLEGIALDTVNELSIAYDDAMARVNDITDDPNAIRQYEQRKKEIEALEVELERRAHHEATKAERIKEMADKWEGNLTAHVAHVNKLFTKYMAEMDCVGEVVLFKGKDDEPSYKDWGIQILVSFRGEAKVQALSAERNSGGERSVCTIMYLMALQERMVAPFRCVDEINQGLDERNERLVFKRIVANSCRAPRKNPSDHNGQYFLITPKLLPNLTDMEHEAVSVLIVVNGPHCFSDSDDWQHFRSMKAQKRRAPGEGDDEENSNNTAATRRISKKGRLS